MRTPWWFSDAGTMRFDPVGGRPSTGASYWSSAALGAWAEVFRTQRLISSAQIDARQLTVATLTAPLVLADLTSNRALAFGFTASLGADEDYTANQAFASAALAAGFGGVRWFVRHVPAQDVYGYALFGAPGAPTVAGSSDVTTAISDALVDDARRTFGQRVLPA